jgi:hypothetical protein
VGTLSADAFSDVWIGGIVGGVGLGLSLERMGGWSLLTVSLWVGAGSGTADGGIFGTSPVRIAVSCRRLLTCRCWSRAKVDVDEE